VRGGYVTDFGSPIKTRDDNQ